MEHKLWQAVTIIAVLLVGGWLLAAPGTFVARAQGADETSAASANRTISVSGTGQASATPDTAVVTLGVEMQAADAGTAVSENNTQMEAVLQALEDGGVAQKDIQSQVIRLTPQYQQPSSSTGSTQGPAELVGFIATDIVQVTVRQIDSLADLIDSAVQAGANQIQGISLEISDPGNLFDQARQAAWEDAMHKAQQLAGLSSSGLGMVLTINETSRTPSPVIESVLGAGGVAAVPVQPGTEMVEVDLQVTWLLTAVTAMPSPTPTPATSATATPTAAPTATPTTSNGGG